MITDEQYFKILENQWVQIAFREWIDDMRKYIGAKITFEEKHGSQTEEIRLKEFNKHFTYGSTIFRCTTCLTPRKYGQHGAPERTMALILCEGICHKHTWHSYIETWKLKGVDNYAGISNNP